MPKASLQRLHCAERRWRQLLRRFDDATAAPHGAVLGAAAPPLQLWVPKEGGIPMGSPGAVAGEMGLNMVMMVGFGVVDGFG